jgi:hypothetical protein
MKLIILLSLLLASCSSSAPRSKQDLSAELGSQQGMASAQGQSDSSKEQVVPVIVNCIQVNTTKGNVAPCWYRNGSADQLKDTELLK